MSKKLKNVFTGELKPNKINKKVLKSLTSEEKDELINYLFYCLTAFDDYSPKAIKLLVARFIDSEEMYKQVFNSKDES